MINQLAFIGCPRSGTRFASKLCIEHGLDIPHERWGKHGISWFYTTADETLRALDSRLTIVHQVRHPLKVIASMVTAHGVTWKFLFSRMNLPMPENLILRSMLTWIHWNQMAERKAALTYQVEKMPLHFNRIMKMAGFSVRLKPNFKTPKNTNTRKHAPLTWNQLAKIDPNLTMDIIALAQRYGYASPDSYQI